MMNMNKIKVCLLIVVMISLLSCKKDVEPNITNFSGRVTRVIVTRDNWAVNFIIAFNNDSDKEVVLFANGFPKSEKYGLAGVMMQIQDFATPLGSFVPPDNTLCIPAHSVRKFFYTYYWENPNLGKTIDIKNADNELKQIIDCAAFSYKYTANTINKYYTNPNTETYFVFDKDFSIQKNNLKIEFTDCLSMDEAMEMIDGKVILQQ
jgi:hypothetical protein